MSREVEFKAWHKEKEEMINYIDNDYENNRQELGD